jgi:hypothetical protein
VSAVSTRSSGTLPSCTAASRPCVTKPPHSRSYDTVRKQSAAVTMVMIMET